MQSVTALVKFLLKQVEFESRRKWSDHEREPDSKQWSNAVGFKELFKSDKVRIHGGWYVCKGRDHAEDVHERPEVSEEEAAWAVELYFALLGGKDFQADELDRWMNFRVFNVEKCTCFAHAPSRLCHRVLALQVHLKQRDVPLIQDDTRCRNVKRDRPGNCYSTTANRNDKEKEVRMLKKRISELEEDDCSRSNIRLPKAKSGAARVEEKQRKHAQHRPPTIHGRMCLRCTEPSASARAKYCERCLSF